MKKRSALKKRFWLKLGFTLITVLIAILIWLDIGLMKRFNGSKWELPATVYARPLALFDGKVITKSQLEEELMLIGFKQARLDKAGFYSWQHNQLTLNTKAFQFADLVQPAMQLTLTFNNNRLVNIAGLPDALHGWLRLNPLVIGTIHPKQHEDRLLVALDEVPPYLIQALLATEDRDFYQHHGISLKAIARAAWINLTQGRVVQGASTLTQQLVKNLFLTDKRSFFRKIEEIILALLLELRASKNEILEAYINEVFIAQDGSRAIHGFGLASEYFFHKKLNNISIAEAALLVGMMKGPSYYNPLRHPERAQERRNLVLKLMYEEGYLDKAQLAQETQRPIQLYENHSGHKHASFADYLQLVKQQLKSDYDEHDLETKGLRIFTNLDPIKQFSSHQALSKGLHNIDQRYKENHEAINGAVVMVNHSTGDIEAVVGGKAFRAGDFNRAIAANRPIGSLVKPAVYLSAIEQGYRLSDLLSDKPYELVVNGKKWQPQNHDGKTHHLGDYVNVARKNRLEGVPFYLAMAKSLNVATVRLGMNIGLPPIISTLQELGVKKPIPEVPSLLLGSLELTPIEVAQLYTTLGSGGFLLPLQTIRTVLDHQGKALKRYDVKMEKQFDQSFVYLINYMLQAVMREGTGSRFASKFPEQMHIAGKSGTTNDLRDNWFAGFDTETTIVVWIGRDDNKPLPTYASSGALPIWADLMSKQETRSFAKNIPSEIQFYWINLALGKVTDKRCNNAVFLPFVKGTEPKEHVSCEETKKQQPWFKTWLD